MSIKQLLLSAADHEVSCKQGEATGHFWSRTGVSQLCLALSRVYRIERDGVRQGRETCWGPIAIIQARNNVGLERALVVELQGSMDSRIFMDEDSGSWPLKGCGEQSWRRLRNDCSFKCRELDVWSSL